MTTLIRRREVHEEVEYRLEWHYKNDPGAGFSFEAKADGKPEVPRFPEGRKNLLHCYANPNGELVGPELVKREWEWTSSAAIRCGCGAEVELDGFTNTCDCGRDYNMSGDLLASRSCWGEETGESLADILRIP